MFFFIIVSLFLYIYHFSDLDSDGGFGEDCVGYETGNVGSLLTFVCSNFEDQKAHRIISKLNLHTRKAEYPNAFFSNRTVFPQVQNDIFAC